MKTSRFAFPGCILLTAIAVFTSAAASQEPPAAESPLAKELKSLRGAWEAESIVNDGETQEPAVRVEITDKRFSFKIGETTISLKMTIDPECTPKLIDLSGDPEASDSFAEDFLAEGIYELDKDLLRICLTPPQGVRERPQKFEAPANTGRVLITLRRLTP